MTKTKIQPSPITKGSVWYVPYNYRGLTFKSDIVLWIHISKRNKRKDKPYTIYPFNFHVHEIGKESIKITNFIERRNRVEDGAWQLLTLGDLSRGLLGIPV